MANERDWRLRGQEDYLQGATLLRKAYRAWSADLEHDHCEFCWTKFMDPTFSAQHAEAIAKDPKILTQGYAVQGRSPLRLELERAPGPHTPRAGRRNPAPL